MEDMNDARITRMTDVNHGRSLSGGEKGEGAGDGGEVDMINRKVHQKPRETPDGKESPSGVRSDF